MFEGVVLITGVMAAHIRGDVFRRMIVSGREEYVPGAGGERESQLRLRYRLSAATPDARCM